MKKFVVFILTIISAGYIFSQARVNEPEPTELVLLAELTEATGWYKDSGIWRSAQNRIPVIASLDVDNNFKSIRVFGSSVGNRNYLLLEIVYERRLAELERVDGQLRTTGFFKEYWVINPQRFIININEGGRRTRNEYRYLDRSLLYRENAVADPAILLRYLRREESHRTIRLHTQYYRPDNVLRFYFQFSSGILLHTALEDFYYEVDANIFREIFGQWIRRR